MPGVVAVVRDGSFLGVVAEREETGDQGRRRRCRFGEMEGGRQLPDPPGFTSTEVDADPGHRHQQQGCAAAGVRRQGGRGDLSPAVPGARRARAVVRGRAVARTANCTVWTHSQGVYPLRGTIARALGMKPPLDPLHPHGRRGLLRPQRRRRRGARRGAAGARGQRPSGARAMDAGRGVHVGALRPRHDHAGTRRRGRRPDRRLELRRLEPEPQHAAGRSRRHQPVVELVSGRPEAAGPGAAGESAELRRRSQRDPDLRFAAADASPIT